MASKTYHIELQITNVDDPERMAEIEQALQQSGQMLASAVTLIVNGGEGVAEPEITIYSENFRDGRKDIPLHNAEEVL